MRVGAIAFSLLDCLMKGGHLLVLYWRAVACAVKIGRALVVEAIACLWCWRELVPVFLGKSR